MAVTVALAATLTAPGLFGCTALHGMHRPGAAPTGTPTAAPRQEEAPSSASVEDARALVVKGRHQEALAALDRALAQHKGSEDAVLMEKAVILASAEVGDYPHAQEALEQLLRKHPRSDYRLQATTLADVLTKLLKLRQDLEQILNIDMEAERRRRGGG